jgi:hypothetical protein
MHVPIAAKPKRAIKGLAREPAHDVAHSQMVPRTPSADFDHIARELVDTLAEDMDLLESEAPAAAALQIFAEDVADEDELAIGADWAGLPRVLAVVNRRTQEVPVSVADVVAGEPALLPFADSSPFGQRVVDIATHHERS